jgi:uncharacterized protein with ATP-grasp and redox domains
LKALEIYPRLQKKVTGSKDRLKTAVEIARAGNIIDYASINAAEVDKKVSAMLSGGQYGGGKKTACFNLLNSKRIC